MKLDEIVALIEKAGFKSKAEGRGIGSFEGYQVMHFEKDIYKEFQCIQLAFTDIKKDAVTASFSINVPLKLRDAVYEIMNEPAVSTEHTLKM
ncbi:hypothetical protein [uncultured Legionella sp.]|uniref:hypothetical protein n=1 Tax=uncultured Legionella sp. TaxID=210934 RepID=UPI002611C97F|nr:hypothetical protein [uncultured Legionella sp.]